MLRYIVICSAIIALSSASHKPVKNSTISRPNFNEKFHWKYINYAWPSYDAYLTAKNDGSYIEKNNIISGIKLWKNRMYLTVPRYRDGVPVTLTSASVVGDTSEPLLEPYPNWDMQKIGDCSALQNVYNTEIDTKGRIWVLDTGRVATMTSSPKNLCPPRLVILDLENNGAVLRSYIFPEDVASNDSAILKDLVIDHEHGGMAYIVDSDEKNPGIIIYSFTNNTSWKVYHENMRYVPDAVKFRLNNNINYFDKKGNINGIALTQASNETSDRYVYYSPLSSLNIFMVPTQSLIDAQNYEQQERKTKIDKNIQTLGLKFSQTDGMIMSNSGSLYFGMLKMDGIALWDSKKYPLFKKGQKLISKDHGHEQWQSSFAFDDKGQLWVITNGLQNYTNNYWDADELKYKALVSKVNMTSYQYYENGSAPEWHQDYENRGAREWNHNYEDGTTTELPVNAAGVASKELGVVGIIAVLLLAVIVREINDV